MSTDRMGSRARVGDRLEAHNVAGGGGRHGQIVAILGQPGHEHYRVRWEDEHESICYPADGVKITHRKTNRRVAAD